MSVRTTALQRPLPLLLLAFACALLVLFPSFSSAHPTYPLAPLHSDCTWFQSRVCTNVVWPVPKLLVKELHHDKLVGDDLMARKGYTGSRTCKRWYTDFKCRSAFPACSSDGITQMPCLAECRALAARCPSLDVKCDTKVLVDDKRVCMPREKLLNTPFTPGMVMP
jgi:hypothetical protein